MLTRLWMVLSCLSLALFVGCGGGSSAAKCVAGATEVCACTATQQGVQTCNSAGAFGTCVCGTTPTTDAGFGDGAAGQLDAIAPGVADGGGAISDAVADLSTTASMPDVPAVGGGGGSGGTGGAGGGPAVDAAMDASADAPVAPGPFPDAAADAGGGEDASSTTPAILSFTASPTTISQGKSSRLSWTVTGATMLSMDQGAGSNLVSVLGMTSRSVTPYQTTTYTLTLNGTASAQVTVTVVPLPSIASFAASPTAVISGGKATLTAAFSGGTGTVDQGIGAVISGSGTSTGPISANTTYTLTVSNAFEGFTTAQVTVMVGVFTATGSLTVARRGHTATLLGSGKVLIAGGNGSANGLASAELYDPASGTFSPTGSMTVARWSHTATLLNNGKVLIAGGEFYNSGGSVASLASAELYDPTAGTFTAASDMTLARTDHTATLLPSGMVLVAGGDGGNGENAVASAELYDPTAGTFSATGNMTMARWSHTATLLGNGKVLIAGGAGGGANTIGPAYGTAELYNPAAGRFTSTGSMTVARNLQMATLLSSEKVLIAGGAQTTSAELYNPTAGTFTATGSMVAERLTGHTATLLSGGKVLIVGGFGVDLSMLASAELYDE